MIIFHAQEITAQKQRVLHKVQGAGTHHIHCLHMDHSFSPYCSFARRFNVIQRLFLLKNYNLV